MKTILVANSKGGSGKTLLSLSLAYALNQGKKVVAGIEDLDSNKGSKMFCETIQPNWIFQENKQEVRIIDCPAGLDNYSVSFLKNAVGANVVIVTSLDPGDIRCADQTIQRFGATKPRHLALALNRVPPWIKAKQIGEYAPSLEIPRFKTVIHYRPSISKLLTHGLYGLSDDAQEELLTLSKEIIKTL